MWDIFKNTGDIQAYLYCKQYDEIKENKEDHEILLALETTESSKVNSI
ncbi:MAG: YqzL family protein [Clostridiaceae bacterium]|nr:YqzL family protein [Clostridiaceae bacterium]